MWGCHHSHADQPLVADDAYAALRPQPASAGAREARPGGPATREPGRRSDRSGDRTSRRHQDVRHRGPNRDPRTSRRSGLCARARPRARPISHRFLAGVLRRHEQGSEHRTRLAMGHGRICEPSERRELVASVGLAPAVQPLRVPVPNLVVQMSVLITGASGFLGSWFADWYIRQNLRVDLWLVDIQPHPTGIPVDQQDLEEWLSDFDRDIDTVFHFAAPVGGREKIEGDPLYNADSLRLDSVMFRWAIKHAKTLVYPSSSAVYGTHFQVAKGHQLQEGMFNPQNPNWYAPDEMYGFTKLVGEMLAYKASKYGLNTLAIRPFSGYGEGQSFDYPVPSIVRRALHHEDPLTVWGPGTQRRDFIHVSDVVAATMARLEHPLYGYESMNLGSGFAVSFNEIARMAAGIAGYEPEIHNLVDKPVGVDTRYCDNQRMARVYEPKVTLLQGLVRMMDWVRSLEEPVRIGA